MIEPEQRPDPDELLARTRVASDRETRGKLRIFFGFAPGVGKTYRMLQVAHDLKIRAGRDVVIGVVEDHRRRETAALTEKLDRLPPRSIEYRGRELEEFVVRPAAPEKRGKPRRKLRNQCMQQHQMRHLHPVLG